MQRNFNMEEVGYMMGCATEMVANYGAIMNIVNVPYLHHGRSEAIHWMISSFSTISFCNDELDIAVQILDKFLRLMPITPEVSFNTTFFRQLGTVCMVISAKYHSCRPPISYEKFTMFETAILVEYESLILNQIFYDINTTATPINFVRCVLATLHNDQLSSLISSTADSLIAEFWTVPQSALYAPSTIAIAGVCTAFAVLEINCESWMQSVSEVYLSCNIPSNHTALFDVTGCYELISNLPLTKRYLSSTSSSVHRVSPISVTSSSSFDEINSTNESPSGKLIDLDPMERGDSKRRRFNRDVDEPCDEVVSEYMMKPIPF